MVNGSSVLHFDTNKFWIALICALNDFQSNPSTKYDVLYKAHLHLIPLLSCSLTEDWKRQCSVETLIIEKEHKYSMHGGSAANGIYMGRVHLSE